MIPIALESPRGRVASETLPPPLVPAAAAGWRRWIAPLISLAVVIAAIVQLRSVDLSFVLHLPTRPLFWLVFAAGYLVLPASEMLIYRRLWQIPASGFVALLRKRVSNEVLLGYSGEAYFYGWARRRAGITTAPFGAIKDVSMLSAAVGNGVTLLLLIVSWPLLHALHLSFDGKLLTVCAGAIALISLGTLCFRRALFSLPSSDLGFIAVVHAARVGAALLLTALLWSLALPAAPLAWWLLLSTIRMLVSRLPFIANKDVVFAGVVAFTMGHEADVAALITVLAALTLAINVSLGAVLALIDVIAPEAAACA